MIELGRIRHFNVRSRESVVKVILDLAAISVRCFGDISPSPLHSLAAFVVACDLLHHLNSLIATVFPTDAVDRFPDRWRGRASDGSSAAFPRRGTLRDRFRVAIEGRTGAPYQVWENVPSRGNTAEDPSAVLPRYRSGSLSTTSVGNTVAISDFGGGGGSKIGTTAASKCEMGKGR